jgi:hypothetical protein
MVAISPSVTGNEQETHVFCSLDFWGEDVPTDQALRIATEHEASDQHIEAEIEQIELEVAIERRRERRGY